MKNAFTLVEVLIVIALLAVLAVIVFVAINPAQRIEDAQNSQARSDVQTLHKAFELYAIDHGGQFPNLDSTYGGGPILSGSSLPGTSCPGNNQSYFLQSIFPTYISTRMSDPFTNSIFVYKVYFYTPANTLVACGPLSDGTSYYYPAVN